MPKKIPQSHAELETMTKDDLVAEADRRGLTVTRSDGEEGEPLKEDYIAAIGAKLSPAARREAPKFVDAQGRPVNEDGERIDERGNVLES